MCSMSRTILTFDVTCPWSNLNQYLKKIAFTRTLIKRGDLETHGLVDLMHDMNGFDELRLRKLVENHLHFTGSERARHILDNWDDYLPKFVKVMPVDYRRALMEMQTRNKDNDKTTIDVAVGD